MRRLLAIVLAAAPLFAGAQTAGTIWFGGSATSPTVNAAQCTGQTSDPIVLTWSITPQTGFVTTGEYRIFAGSSDAANTQIPYCLLPGPGVAAVRITPTTGTPDATQVTSTATVSAASLAGGAVNGCGSDATVFVCVLWYKLPTDPDASPAAYAKGTVSLKVAGPGQPTVTGVSPGDGALIVTATHPDGTNNVVAVTWRAAAHASTTADTTTHYSAQVAVGTEARIGGLSNSVSYYVTAFTYSAEGNESPESAPVGPVMPQPAADAWQVYKLSGGRDSGGCDAGPAGLLALLGAAALVRIRRLA